MSQALALRTSILLADLLSCWGGHFDGVGDVLSYEETGKWSTGVAEPVEWNYSHSAGCAAAQQYAYGQLPPSKTNLERAIATINRCIATFQLPDGGWQDYNAGAAVPLSNDIATYFWGVELATAYLALKPEIGSMPAWEESLKASCDFLETKEVIGGRYYSNGNIQIGYVELLELTYLATEDPAYQALAATALAWAKAPATNPSNPLIGGGAYGWVEEVVPVQADGSDGKGYFREWAAGNSAGITAPGLDWRYTNLQAAVVSRMYLATNKPEYLRMANMLLNKVWDRVNTGTWVLNIAGGSRYPTAALPSASDNFYNCAPFILSWKGGNVSRDANFASLLTFMETTFRSALNARVPNYMRDSSKMLAAIVRAGA